MDYSSYKFYRGEEECPETFDSEQSRLWNAERIFEMDFQKNESSDWYAFFEECEVGGKNASKIFIQKLDETEYEKPKDTSKKWIFNLWLDYYPRFFACRRIGVEDE